MARALSFVFRKVWPDESQVRTWADLFLLDQVVRQVLEQYGPQIERWNIHRRWAGGKHEFTFWCWAPEDVGNHVKDSLGAHRGVAELQRAGVVCWEDTVESLTMDIGDGAWDPILRSCWPQFIQGISQTLLDLLAQMRGTSQPPRFEDGKGLGEIETYYSRLEGEVYRVWFRDAAHAFMHMMHEVFGYGCFQAAVGVAGWPQPATTGTGDFRVFPGHHVLNLIGVAYPRG